MSKSCIFYSRLQADVGHGFSAELNLGCSERDASHVYRIYVATFLGFGGNVARTRYEQLLISQALQRHENSSEKVLSDSHSVAPLDHKLTDIKDPCLPRNMNTSVQHQDTTFTFLGTGQ